MPTYREINRMHHPATSPQQELVILTLLSSYLMARGSDPDVTSRQRTALFMLNGLFSLRLMELNGNIFRANI